MCKLLYIFSKAGSSHQLTANAGFSMEELMQWDFRIWAGIFHTQIQLSHPNLLEQAAQVGTALCCAQLRRGSDRLCDAARHSQDNVYKWDLTLFASVFVLPFPVRGLGDFTGKEIVGFV